MFLNTFLREARLSTDCFNRPVLLVISISFKCWNVRTVISAYSLYNNKNNKDNKNNKNKIIDPHFK